MLITRNPLIVIPVTASTFIVNGEEAPAAMLVCRAAVLPAASKNSMFECPSCEAALLPNCALVTVNAPLPSGAV